MDEVVPMPAELKPRMATDLIAHFEWEANQQEWRLNGKMMVFLQFRADGR